ncbi:MAG TPA: trypsin-like serine protease, partial [Polyangiaceae bacterium]|nr:trypsin-like serine protease [Polyangiaceae bacterium]
MSARTSFRVAGEMALLSFAPACAGPSPVVERCEAAVAPVPQAVVNGSSINSYLGLDERAAEWVVKVSPQESLASEPPVCTGFAISPTMVVTSTHCKEGASMVATVLAGVSERVIKLIDVRVHDTLPVVLAAVDSSERFQFTAFAPLGVDQTSSLIRTRATVAGYGEDEYGRRGSLRFLVEEIIAIKDEAVLVTANGAGGPCNGDSGAPLIVRQSGGTVAVLGVLRGGSQNCRGVDLFVRSDILLPWIEREAGPVPPAPLAADCSE